MTAQAKNTAAIKVTVERVTLPEYARKNGNPEGYAAFVHAMRGGNLVKVCLEALPTKSIIVGVANARARKLGVAVEVC
jgi:hypothetical protein